MRVPAAGGTGFTLRGGTELPPHQTGVQQEAGLHMKRKDIMEEECGFFPMCG